MADKLRVAFIGAGGIAGTHMRYYRDMADVELVAAADVSAAAVKRRCQEFGIPHSYTDYETMLARIDADAVSVCTPNGLHVPCTIAALEAGLHVLVEKPLAMNAQEGQKMVDTAKARGLKLVIGFQHRYEPRTRFVKNAVDDGTLGRILYGRVQALRRRGIPNWGVFGRKDLQGGGPLIDIGVHVLEMCHFTMGAPKPVAAVGIAHTYIGDKPSKVVSQWENWDHATYTVEDLAVGHIRFDDGSSLSIEASFAAHIEKNEWNFTLMGEKGGATWDPPSLFTDSHGHMIHTKPDFLPSGARADHFRLKMRNFVDHVLYDKPTMAPAEHGLMVQKMLDGLYQSAEAGGEVAIN